MKTIRSANDSPVTLDGDSLDVLPTPQQIKLKTADDVRCELARVYRDMRQGRIKTSNGTKFAFVLGHIGKMIETNDIEKRIEQLELKGKK